MKSKIVFSTVVVALLTTVLIAASPTTKPDQTLTADQGTGPWHVSVLPSGGQSTSSSGAILWNNQTGETWLWSGTGVVKWTRLER